MEKQNKEEEKDDMKVAPLFPSSRLLLGLMNCLALLFLYLLRINLSISMVCMVRKPVLPMVSNVSSSDLSLNESSFLDLHSETTNFRFDPSLHMSVIPTSTPASVQSSAILSHIIGTIVPPSAARDAADLVPVSVSNASRFIRAAANSLMSSSSADIVGQSVTRVMAENMEDDYNATNDKATGTGEFEWSRQFQGYVLSSYFYGYLVTQVLGGFLSGKYGAKHVLGTGMIIMVVMTMLTPVAARISAYLLIVLRIILGAAGGVFFPSVQSLWGPWAPPFERSFLVSLTFFGITFGNILALGASSLFCSLSTDNGWPFAFYSTGAAGLGFWVCWNFCVYSTPMQHPRITEREKNYIQRCIGSKSRSKKIERIPVPWLKILSSPAVWAILTAQTANTWFTHTSITLPLYMRDVLKFDIKQNGTFLILPYIIDIIVTPFVSKLADYLRAKRILSTVVVRKVYQSTSCLVCSILLISLSFIDYDRRYVAVGLLCLIYPFQNLYRSGYAVNLQDIAPKFAGEIFGITNTAGTICGIVSPVIVGALTTHGTKQEWQAVFYISAGFFIFGGVIFAIFARGEIQPWADPIKAQVLLVNDVASVENGAVSAEEKKSPIPDDDDGKGGLEEGKTISNGQCNLETEPLNERSQ